MHHFSAFLNKKSRMRDQWPDEGDGSYEPEGNRSSTWNPDPGRVPGTRDNLTRASGTCTPPKDGIIRAPGTPEESNSSTWIPNPAEKKNNSS